MMMTNSGKKNKEVEHRTITSEIRKLTNAKAF